MARLAAALCALPLLTFVPFLGGGLLTDDFRHLATIEAAPDPWTPLVTADTFDMFRPVVQATLLAEIWLWDGPNPAAMRAFNLLLHVLVIASAFVVARLILRDVRPALLAALALALTPKAPAIAVLWISARAELLMSLFCVLGLICWIQWDRGSRRRDLAGACVCYLLALLSKETAVLLPVLMLATPPDPHTPLPRRATALALLVVVGLTWFVLRQQTGAVMPAAHGLYSMLTPPAIWFDNLGRYLARSVLSAGAMVAVAGVVAALGTGSGRTGGWFRPTTRQLGYAVVWFAVFILPVLPIVGRSEIRVYLPGFGFCLLAAAAVWRVMVEDRRRAIAALALLAVTLGAYQVFRAQAMHDDLIFSQRFVAALASSPHVRRTSGEVVEIVPGDPSTERFLLDVVGGYLPQVLRLALGRDDLDGGVAYTGQPQRVSSLRLQCIYRGGMVSLTLVPVPGSRLPTPDSRLR